MYLTSQQPINAIAYFLAVTLCSAAPVFAAQQSSYPDRPIRLLVGFNAGGGTDITARTVGLKLGESLGQSIVVDNRAAAGGVLARSLAADANADGYTLLMLSGSQVIGAALVYKKPVDMRNTFTAISTLTRQPYLLSTNPKLPIKTVKDLIGYAKSRPGKLNYGSTGFGSMAHLASALFNNMAETNIVHVPYKGASPGLLDLIAGEIQMLFSSSTSGMPHIKAGRLRLLASSSGERSAVLPDVPTVAESGLPGFDVSGWYGIVAPAKTPRAIITKLNAEIAAALKRSDVRRTMAIGGAEAWHTTPQQFTTVIAQDEKKWLDLVKATGLKLQAK